MSESTVLVTGAAGFIGHHVCERLLTLGHKVVGLDSLNDYYDPGLKRARLARTEGRLAGFVAADVAEEGKVDAAIADHGVTHVVHLAAQAGVRYSLTHPDAFVQANLVGFNRLVEACRRAAVAHLVYASSSSVYGLNARMPFSTDDPVDHPISLYAATKRSNELVAHAYSHLYRLPTTGLRFFTVYGPWGRPDMAPMLFARAIMRGESIDVFNEGRMKRDFTYVEDVADGVVRVLFAPPAGTGEASRPSVSPAPYRLYNIGAHQPVELLRFIQLLAENLGRKADMRLLPMQAGDVVATYADVADLMRDTGYAPTTSVEVGVTRFVAWFRDYYGT